jgi:phosphoribosylglycinamide formyltransferase-1
MRSIVERFSNDSSSGVFISAVISDVESAEGLKFANAQGITTNVVKRNKGKEGKIRFTNDLINEVNSHKPDLVVLAGFMQVLDSSFIKAFERKIINIHPSLLPAFKGLHVHQRAIDAGAKFSGCTVHYVNEEVDSGEILGQAVVPIHSTDTADVLASRILKQEHLLFPRVIAEIAKKKIIWNKLSDGTYKLTQSSELFLEDNDAALISCTNN